MQSSQGRKPCNVVYKVMCTSEDMQNCFIPGSRYMVLEVKEGNDSTDALHVSALSRPIGAA